MHTLLLKMLPALVVPPAFLIVLPSYQWQSAEPWSWPNQPGTGSYDEAPGEGPGKNKPGGSSSLALSNTHTFS